MQFATTYNGVTDSQRALVEYWNNKRIDSGHVRRTDIDPGSVRAYLSSISIVEVTPDGHARFRLVGSRMRDMLGEDPRGKSIDDVTGIDVDMFERTVSVALNSGEPTGGVIERDGAKLAWLRLPLVGEDGQWSQVMCYDEFLVNLDNEVRAA